MDMDINYQKVMKKLKIKLFKSERYFEFFKSILLILTTPSNSTEKKEKVYNLINSKHSIKVKPTRKFWVSIYFSLHQPSTIFSDSDDINILEEKYIQYFAKLINKQLCSLSIIYSAPLKTLKQEYLNLCIKFMNNTRNKRMKTLRLISKKDKRKTSRMESKKMDKDIDGNDNEKSSEDDDNEENHFKKYWKNKKPKTLLEKEIFRLKVKSSNQVVEEFIGNINKEKLENNKKEITFLYFIKNKKNKVFKQFLSKQNRKNFVEIIEKDIEQDFKYKNVLDNCQNIFPLKMKIKNSNYCKNKKKREKRKYNSTLNSRHNETYTNANSNFNTTNNEKCYYSSVKRYNSPQKGKLIKNNTNRKRILNSAKVRNCYISPESSKYVSLNSRSKINASLPLLSKKNFTKKDIKYCTNINKKFFINRSDLFY